MSLQHQLSLRPTSKLTSSPRKTSRSVDSNLARVPLSEKMQDEILSAYLRRCCSSANNDDDSNTSSSYSWSQVVQEATMYAKHTPPHSEQELKSLVNILAQKFPTVPSDCNPRRKYQLLNHHRAVAGGIGGAGNNIMPSSSPRNQQQQEKEHVFDISPRELLTSRGASMFPPLQKMTPRTSSTHNKFRTAASDHLLVEERHFSPSKPPPKPVVAHHFGKGNTQSPRRVKNTNAIQQTFSMLTLNNNDTTNVSDENTTTNNNNNNNRGTSSSSLASREEMKKMIDLASKTLPQNKPVNAESLHRILHNNNSNNNSKNFKLASQLSPEELEQFIADNTTNNNNGSSGNTRFKHNNNNSNNNTISGSRRFGLFFTNPQKTSDDGGAEGNRHAFQISSKLNQSKKNNNNTDGNSSTTTTTTVLMTDEMMDRLRDKQQQRRTRQDLDVAMNIRRQQMEARKAEFQNEVERERLRGVAVAEEEAAEKSAQQEKRHHLMQLAEEQKIAQRRRIEKQQADRRAQEQYAHYAEEENRRGMQEALLTSAVQRHRKEEAAKVNLEMASARKQQRLQNQVDERHLEQKLLEMSNSIAVGGSSSRNVAVAHPPPHATGKRRRM